MDYNDHNSQKVIRHRAENDFLFFTRYFFYHRMGSKFIVNWHHEKIVEYLMAVMAGDIKNLIINVAPGSTKTELVSISWPAYCLALEEYSRFLHLSYSHSLASLNSQTCRDIVTSSEYQDLWHREISSDSKARNRWNVMKGDKKAGGIYADSSGGQVTGFRAGYMKEGFTGAIIIDDAMKPEEAASDKERERHNGRLASTIRSRRALDSTPIVIIGQRLHEMDTTGYLMGDGIGEEFEILKIPAILNKDGQEKSYWEFKEPLESLKTFERVHPYEFASQYMQDPSPREGNIINRKWWKYYRELPPFTFLTWSWDTAVKTGERNSYSVGTLWAQCEAGHYLMKMIRVKLEYPELLKMVKGCQDSDQANEVIIEDKASGQQLIQELGRKGNMPIIAIKPGSRDKVERLHMVAPTIEAGKVHLPQDDKDMHTFVEEFAAFPTGQQDDIIDSTSQYLHRRQAKSAPRVFGIQRLRG